MAEKVKLSKDGSSIDFVQSDSLPTSMKKFRQSPEIEGFYRFIYENDLQKEAYEILDRIIIERKARKASEKAAVRAKEKEAKMAAAAQLKQEVKAAAVAKPAKAKAAEKAKPAKAAKAAAKPAKAKAKPAKKAAPKAAAKKGKKK